MYEPKRVRQACRTCRRRKARCSGERPICALCARLGHSCTWEKSGYGSKAQQPLHARNGTSISITESRRRVSVDETLASRVAQLEQRLAAIDEQDDNGVQSSPRVPFVGRHSLRTDPPVPTSQPDDDLDALPPKQVLSSLIDTFFEFCHNQPYAYFHETSARQQIADGMLPDHLLYAVAAAAVRFSHHSLYKDRTRHAIDAYANRSWLLISQHLSCGQVEYDLVKTVCMLAAIDAAICASRAAHLKLAVAVQLANELRLYEEPSDELAFHEQEERRRTFWSLYLMDRIMAVGHNHPPSFVDSDCTVHLPCHEDSFKLNQLEAARPQCTLEQVLRDPSAHQIMSHFALAVLMASATGQFIRFCLKSVRSHSHALWDPGSTYLAVNRILQHFEALSPCTYTTFSDTLHSLFTIYGNSPDRLGTHQVESDLLDKPSMGHFVFAQLLYHLNHCLFNHPFVLSQILQSSEAAVPLSFVQDAFQKCRNHASQLTRNLNGHCNALSNVVCYGYCAMVTGIIHRIFQHSEDGEAAEAAAELAQQSLWFLEQSPVRFEIFDRELAVLRSFDPDPDIARTLSNPINVARKDLILDGSPGVQLLDYAKIPELRLLFPLEQGCLGGLQVLGDSRQIFACLASDGSMRDDSLSSWSDPVMGFIT